MVHPKMKLLSSFHIFFHTYTICLYFFRGTQRKMFRTMFTLLFSIQLKWMVTSKKTQKYHKNP